MMNDELKTSCLQFIIHHSAFIIHSSSFRLFGAALGHRADDLVLRNISAAKLCDRATVAHDDDARASLDQLFKLGRDHQHAESRRGKFVDERLNLALCADVYAARRLVEDKELRVLAEPAREKNLLL